MGKINWGSLSRFMEIGLLWVVIMVLGILPVDKNAPAKTEGKPFFDREEMLKEHLQYRSALQKKAQLSNLPERPRQPGPSRGGSALRERPSNNSLPVTGSKAIFGKYSIRRVLTVSASAYTFTGHHTATGVTPYRGVVAVDPRVISLGTLLYVEGYGYAKALDTGGAIKGNKIDLFFTTRQEALKWGRRKVTVYILK